MDYISLNLENIVIIGSGFSSLSAACYLQKAGYQVTVLEKNEQLGGRASMLEIDGFRFDMGPSWYWMPDIFEKFFSDFGKKPSDYYELTKLSPAYRVVFGKNDFIDIPDNLDEIITIFETIESGSGMFLKKFIFAAKKNYEIAMQDLVYQPGQSVFELMSWETIKRLNLFFQNISGEIRKNIKNPKLISILEFPVLFLGAKPEDTPAFYNFMNYADFGLGTWYPKGGFNQVAKGFVSLAKELGVKFMVNETVKEFKYNKDAIETVVTNKDQYQADLVVTGADYAHTEQLLSKELRNYSDDYWTKRTFAPSALLYYVGFNKKIKHLLHHNLFFDTDFTVHAKEIYDDPKFPTKPLFYANFSSITEPALAPENGEVGFFLIPIAVDLEDNKEIQEKYFNIIIDRINNVIGEDVSKNIIFKKCFGIKDFKERYNSCRGNAYGLANTLLQTSVLRPSIKSKRLKNLFYTGQLTVPGPGVPPAIISGKIVSDFIIKTK